MGGVNHSKLGSPSATAAPTIESNRPNKSPGKGEPLPTPFALAVEPVELVEERRECIREAKFSLARWERTRNPLDLARMLAALEMLRALTRGEA